jgi:hypothetical protein
MGSAALKNTVAIDMENLIYYEMTTLAKEIIQFLQKPKNRKIFIRYLLKLGWKNLYETLKEEEKPTGPYYRTHNTYFYVGKHTSYTLQYLLEDDKSKNIINFEYLKENAPDVLKIELFDVANSLYEIKNIVGQVERLAHIHKYLKTHPSFEK